MTFFNKKEEVLDIELTPHGKGLLSQGKFRPSYYLFFDDDVLYDSSCAGTSTEAQKDIHKRILTETPKMKTQYAYSERKEGVWHEDGVTTVEKHFSLISSLGTSDALSDLFPRWKIRMFGNDGPKISSSTEYLNSPYGAPLRIPQNDITVNFKTAVSSELAPSIINEDPNLSSTTQADSTYISVQPRTILMQILEDNSVFEKENFDIEVYIKETENDPRISDPADASAAASLGYWRPLSFKREQPKIVDGILVDEQMEMCQELDSSYVEYWFSVQADSEISEGLREKVAEVIRTNSLYLH